MGVGAYTEMGAYSGEYGSVCKPIALSKDDYEVYIDCSCY